MKPRKKGSGSSSSSRIEDVRFANFETDPRFRLPSKKYTKTKLDKRFAGMLDDEDFINTARVDRYGRKVKSDTKRKALQSLYRQDNEGEDEDEGKDTDEAKSQDDEEQIGAVDDDEVVQRELRKAHEMEKPRDYDPARHGGFSSTESDSESDSEDDEDDDSDEEGAIGLHATNDIQRSQHEYSDIETGEVTNRIAVVNLDWDHVKSTDLMALFSSFLSDRATERIVKISVYPSEFGKERMQQEELEGPPKALFKDEKGSSDDSEDGSDSEDEKIKKELMQEGDDQDFDSDALRAYQLDRLRYFYAVIVCSTPEAAQKIYEATDGTEYQSSSNVIDLRFVPDNVTFDDEPRDECDKVPESYRPVEFITNALQSSKVKLTWDMHPEEASRKESINRAFTGSRADIEENDIRAYLASDSEDDKDEADGNEDGAGDAAGPKLSKRELAREKMREALGLASESSSCRKPKNGPVGDMEITFAPALPVSKTDESDKEETTIEKYKRKERERKEKKRQSAKAKRGLTEENGEGEQVIGATAGNDLGFDDPFFTTEAAAAPSKTSIRKEERLRKREAREAAEAESAAQKAQLKKVLAEDANDDEVNHLDHFDMNEIMRAEKKEMKKKKKKKKKTEKKDRNKGQDSEDRGGLQEDFEMDLGDDRFKAIFDSHEFAIDPSNPKFKGTGGMRKLLEEGRKKRRSDDGDDGPRSKKAKKGRR